MRSSALLLALACALVTLPAHAAPKAAAATAPAAPAFKAKEAGQWGLRLRALGVMPDETGDVRTAAGAATGLNAEVGEDWIPELDISYFFTKNIAAELILGTSRHKVNAVPAAGAAVPVGDVSLLPPTLTVQYHPLPESRISPYFGAGLNYTIFYGEDAEGSTVTSTAYDDNFGYALQAGVDIAVMDGWSVNLDVKKLWLGTTLHADSALGKLESEVDIDPVLIGVGVGYRF